MDIASLNIMVVVVVVVVVVVINPQYIAFPRTFVIIQLISYHIKKFTIEQYSKLLFLNIISVLSTL